MTEELDVKLAKINWLQNVALALFAAGFIILGFTLTVDANAIATSALLLSIPHASPPTTNSTIQYVFNVAQQDTTAFLIAAILSFLAGIGVLIASWHWLSRIS